MDNHTFNLVETLSEKGEAVWAYDKFMKDSENCPDCASLWKELKVADSAHTEKIKQLLVSHAQKGMLK